jgi:hypothetical protein
MRPRITMPNIAQIEKGEAMTPSRQSHSIAIRQTEQYAQRLQSAAKLEYDRAILLRRVKMYVNFALAGGGPTLVLFRPGSGAWLGALAGGWLFISRFTIEPRAARQIQRGAIALEEFDCHVLELRWNKALGEPLAKEEIFDSSDRSAYSGEWYPDVTGFERPQAVLICQRSNVVWSRRQHAIYATIVSVCASAWLAIGIVIAMLSSVGLSMYLITVGLPSAPTLLDAVEIRNANLVTVRRRQELEVTIDDAIRHANKIKSSDAFLRSVQNQIFAFRSSSPLIPKLIYRWLRPRYNKRMQQATETYMSGSGNPP